jgi:hypothetical protein
MGREKQKERGTDKEETKKFPSDEFTSCPHSKPTFNHNQPSGGGCVPP